MVRCAHASIDDQTSARAFNASRFDVQLINVGFGLKRDQPVEEIEIEIEEEEEEPENNEDAEINPDDLEVEEIQPEKEDDDEPPSDDHKKDDL